MKARALIECTIDLSQPHAEISAVINAVLGTLPTPAARLDVLTALGNDIDRAISEHTEETEAAA